MARDDIRPGVHDYDIQQSHAIYISELLYMKGVLVLPEAKKCYFFASASSGLEASIGVNHISSETRAHDSSVDGRRTA